MKKLLIDYLSKDYVLNVSMIEPVKCDTAEILFASKSCAFVKDKASDVYMLQTEDLAVADKLFSGFPQDAALVTHNSRLTDFAVKKLGFNENTPCYQAVYRGEKFVLPPSELSLRLMREDECSEAVDMYGFSPQSALEHIKKGLVYCAIVGDKIVGMVGMHKQGTMGMLEVKQEYRRRGYAEQMEKLLINSLMDRGLVPYCQIIYDNTPSLNLQRKLGLELSETLIYWLHKEK